MRLTRSLFRLILLILVLIILALAILKPEPAVKTPDADPLRPPLVGQIDRILVEKSARQLTVFRGGQPLRSYQVALGSSPVGDKLRQGDGKTPEGIFRINRLNSGSRFHLSLGLDYPRAADVIRARAGGYDPGGDIMIHGQPNAFFGKATLAYDWTAGCIALADADVEELWRVTKVGTVVEVRP